MVVNLFGRVSWSLAISTNFCNDQCRLLLSMVEIVRRCGWLVLRLEAPWTLRAAAITPNDTVHVRHPGDGYGDGSMAVAHSGSRVSQDHLRALADESRAAVPWEDVYEDESVPWEDVYEDDLEDDTRPLYTNSSFLLG